MSETNKKDILEKLISESNAKLAELKSAPNKSKKARLMKHLKKYHQMVKELDKNPEYAVPPELQQLAVPVVCDSEGAKKRKFESESDRIEFQRKRQARVLGKDDDYIARQKRSEEKKQERQDRKEKKKHTRNVVCFSCNKKGHSMDECPQLIVKGGSCAPARPVVVSPSASASLFCYNCGETGHSLKFCPKALQGDGLSFAECFLCHEKGHTAGKCPTNENGIYRFGGACHKCGGKDHLAKDCHAPRSSKLKSCGICGDPNHFARDCPQSQPKEKRAKLVITQKPSSRVITF